MVIYYCFNTDAHNIKIASSNFKAFHDYGPQYS